jgi:hypothetical protein
MRGIPGFNYPAFMEAAEMLRDAGWIVFNPAEMDMVKDGIDYSQLSEEAQHAVSVSAELCRKFATRDLKVILSFRGEDGDAIVNLTGWEGSTGARAENAVADWCMVERYTVKEALLEGGYR